MSPAPVETGPARPSSLRPPRRRSPDARAAAVVADPGSLRPPRRQSPGARAAAVVADPRWAAVLAADTAADGTFFYAVGTTGVYCVPSCGARRPRPENVSFHRTALEAERAGFRPCRRCRPERRGGTGMGRGGEQTIAEVCRLLATAERTPTLHDLARRFRMSPFHLHRRFKAATGLTPRAYAAAERAEALRRELARAPTITEAIYGAGYGSAGRFYERAPGVLGMTPSQYRAGGDGLQIRLTVRPSSLGLVLVAATERGICAILLGDDPGALRVDLERRFPKAAIGPGDAAFDRLVSRVVERIEHPARPSVLPLDLRGTAFQHRVWQALQRIPPGETASYAEIAAAIGAPRSARAVARACASNPVAVLVPCHRVIRSDGDRSGYRWGAARKTALLRREARKRP